MLTFLHVEGAKKFVFASFIYDRGINILRIEVLLLSFKEQTSVQVTQVDFFLVLYF